MSTVVKTIKSYSTDDTIYPITKASAVYMANSTIDTVESKIAQIEENKLEKINPYIPMDMNFTDQTNLINWETKPSSYLSGNSLVFRNSDGYRIGMINSFQNEDGVQGIRILGFIGNSTAPGHGTSTYHGFSIGTKQDGSGYFIPNGSAMTTRILEGLNLDKVDNTYYKTTVVSNILTPSSSANIISAGCVRYGKVVQINIIWTNKNSISVPAGGNLSNFTMGTLVSGLRPQISSVAHSQGDDAGATWYSIAAADSNTPGAIMVSAMESTGSTRTIAANSTFTCRGTFIL